MKLAAIYNVWDNVELLKYSMESLRGVDVYIIVFQNVSNYGEYYAPLQDMDLEKFNAFPKFYSPDLSKPGFWNETKKRTIGIQAAKEMDCTHFLMVDCDEMYRDFPAAYMQYEKSGAEGSVCRINTYFKEPNWRLAEFDNYYVPFIHRLRTDTIAGADVYPFYVDPTRRVNCTDVALIDEPMHHFSYVRKDIERKCRNSSARDNIAKSQLLADYYSKDCGPGFYVKDFRQKLIEVENVFNIRI